MLNALLIKIYCRVFVSPTVVEDQSDLPRPRMMRDDFVFWNSRLAEGNSKSDQLNYPRFKINSYSDMATKTRLCLIEH